MLTLDEVKRYLSIDFDDLATDQDLQRMMLVADSYLQGSIGADYPKEDERAKQLALLLISDLYENRDMSCKASVNTRRLVDDMSLQLRAELARGGRYV